MSDNVFTKKRKTELHTVTQETEKAKSKGIAFYQVDIERMELLKKNLSPISRKPINDSSLVRTALAYLKESESKGGSRFEKDIERLIALNS